MVRSVIVRREPVRFAPGELPLVLLALTDIGPMKAYELIAELERLFAPSYHPSPGGIYPAITALVEERLLKASGHERGKCYSITRAGRTVLGQRRRQLAAIEARTGVRLREDGTLGPVIDRFVERVMQVSGRVDPALVERLLERTATRIERMEAQS